MAMKMAEFSALLKGVKRDGNQWKALCPGHRDRKPSLSIKEADGKILLHCHAGCKLEDILKPLGLEPKDLFLNNRQAKLKSGKPGKIEAIYHYTDAYGKPFEVVRTRPKGFYQRQPDGKDGYINSLKGIMPALYHQSDLPTAIKNNDTIFLVEGEKDCDNLWGIGLVATTNPMGAGKWRNVYSEALRGADLVIIPDNDAPGHDHADQVAKSCYGKAARIRLLELPVEYADISDWLDKGNSPGDLEKLIDGCPDYEPPMGIKSAQEFMDEQKNKPKVPFLIDQIFPDGKDPVIICGRPQIGKTNLSLYMAFQLADGYPIFDFKTQACKVAYLFMEGGPQQIMDRVEKLARHLRGIPHNLYIQPSDPLPLNPKGQDILTALVDGIKVCFVDSLKYLIPGDYMKPSDALKGMTALAKVERKTGCRFVLIGHIRKPDRKRVSDPDDYWTELKGPTEYLEICNSALMLSRPRHGDKDSNGRFLLLDENIRILYFIKARDSDRELKPLKLKFYRDELLLKPTIEVAQESLL